MTREPAIQINPFHASMQKAARDLVLEGLSERFDEPDPGRNPDLDDIATTYGPERFFVALRGAELVGTGAVVPEAPGVARIVRMSVARAHRRCGIGKAILNHLLSVACDWGCHTAVLETTPTWHDAIAFYRAQGFALESYHAARDEAHLRKRLNAAPDTALATGVAAAFEEGQIRKGGRLDIQISEQPVSALAEYAAIRITFEVRGVLDVEVDAGGLGGITLSERPVPVPYTKDYDATKEGGPLRWPERFDLSRWGLLMAHRADQCVGGAAVVRNAPEVNMLEGRDDLAVLWDIRVQPGNRGCGVGAALFQAAEAWARARGCRRLMIETQNINVPACRFYIQQGCVLSAIHRFAYPDCPDEVQLLWYKNLRRVRRLADQ